MKKEDLMKIEGMNEELAAAVETATEAELGSTIPKYRFDEVNTKKTEFEKEVGKLNKKIETLEKAVEVNPDVEALNKKIKDLEIERDNIASTKDAEIKQLKVDTQITDALKSANAKNLKAVKALLSLDNIELDEAGNIKDLDAQIKTLQEADDTKFLFESKQQQQQTPFMKGVTPATPPAKAGDSSSTQQSLKEAIAGKIFAKNTQE